MCIFEGSRGKTSSGVLPSAVHDEKNRRGTQKNIRNMELSPVIIIQICSGYFRITSRIHTQTSIKGRHSVPIFSRTGNHMSQGTRKHQKARGNKNTDKCKNTRQYDCSVKRHAEKKIRRPARRNILTKYPRLRRFFTKNVGCVSIICLAECSE